MGKGLSANRVDQLNVGLVLVALAVAVCFPYRGFLVAYAVLGPLHYLTELNWLHGRDYFIKDRRWLWVALVAALAIGLPKLANPKYPTAAYFPDWLAEGLRVFNGYTNGFVLVGFVLAMGFVLTQNRTHRLIVLGLGIGLALLLNHQEFYILLIGLLVPTLIHVYLFTLLFMVFGAKKSGSRWGFVAVGLAMAVPIFIALFDPTQMTYVFPESAKAAFEENNFYVTNVLFGKSIGLTDGTRFDWYGRLFLRLQIFITFAYVYHYLNWFSKTSIIGWHRNLNWRGSVLLVALWLGLVGLFAYDYKVGFLAALSLSFLHVLGEFPLNVVTIRSLLGRR